MRYLSSLALALCACAPEVASDGGTSYPPLQLDGKNVLGSFAVVNGTFAWSQVRGPRAGTEVYEIAEIPGSTDVWLLGAAIERWNGTEVTARFSIPSGESAGLRLKGALDSVAVISANDIWACGTHLMHFDGSTWTDETARLGSTAYLINGCTVAGPSGGKVHVMGPSLAVIENGAVTAVPGTNFVDDTTGMPVLSNTGFTFSVTNVPRDCLMALPTGEAGVIGVGAVVRAMNGQLRVRRAFGPFTGLCRHARLGDTVYMQGTNNDVPFLKADLPGDLGTFASLPQSAQASAGLQYLAAGATADVIAPAASGALFGMDAQDLKGFRLSAFVEVNGTTPTVLADRFYGYHLYAAHQNATRLLVAVQGGGLFQGVKR
ncbi:MAG: hypothetical protein Q8L48_14090 [Archangium sp.]|nr:hypothetical protein [Archangium sp.]